MFIETQSTPNPQTLKFLPDVAVTGNNASAEFANPKEAEGFSGLAEDLFKIKGVKGIFLGHDFLSVTKDASTDWAQLKPELLSQIQSYLQSGKPVLENVEEGTSRADGSSEDQEIIGKIKNVLDTYVRPAVAGDGGDITYRDYKDGVVYLTLRGACSGCPSSQVTLKHGVESLIKHYVPQVKAVEEMGAQ